jgi:putative FmdB family regulatory protein
VPLYEYRCRVCDAVFEARRPMAEAAEPAECPAGHVDSRRVMSVFTSVGAGPSGGSGPAAGPTGGVPCGSACACHPH